MGVDGEPQKQKIKSSYFTGITDEEIHNPNSQGQNPPNEETNCI